jgi:hypothetical protein
VSAKDDDDDVDDDVAVVVESAVGEGPASGVSASAVVVVPPELLADADVVVAKPRAPIQRCLSKLRGIHGDEDEDEDDDDDERPARLAPLLRLKARPARISSSLEKEGRDGGKESGGKASHEHDGPALILCRCCRCCRFCWCWCWCWCSIRHRRRRCVCPATSRCQLASCCLLTDEEAVGLREDDDDAAASAINLLADDEDAMVGVVLLLLLVVVVVRERGCAGRSVLLGLGTTDCRRPRSSTILRRQSKNDWSSRLWDVTSRGYPRHNNKKKAREKRFGFLFGKGSRLPTRGGSSSRSRKKQSLPRFVPKML